jgi:CRISPR-associated endonuclease/helicase Cas3
MSSYFAHSANSLGAWHHLPKHLQDVAHQARRFAAPFGAGEFGYWSGLWHDLGKFGLAFQQYLKDPSAGRGPDHSSAGAVFACASWDGLAFLIAGHHAGLPSHTHLKNRLRGKQGTPAVDEALQTAQRVMTGLRPATPLARLLPPFAQASRHACEMFLRMVFSALVDADFLDTERHFQPDRAGQRGNPPSLEELWQLFEADQAGITGRRQIDLQQARHEIYQACLAAAEAPPGLFRLTAPTGGGKTRSGMAFALRHALRHGLQRVIVVIPYTSIIEQTADVYRAIFGDDAVLEHHSAVGTLDDESPVTELQVWSRLASENWDARIVVTTTVQLFESLFANRPAPCRKLHRLARSVIVLDEVQTLPYICWPPSGMGSPN